MTMKMIVLAAVIAAVPAVASAQQMQQTKPGSAPEPTPAPMMNNSGTNPMKPAGEAGRTVGSTAATAAAIPDALIQSVRGSKTQSVKIREQLATGERVPRMVHLHTVRAFPNYRYAVVNDQRLIVDPHSRKIMQIVQ